MARSMKIFPAAPLSLLLILAFAGIAIRAGAEEPIRLPDVVGSGEILSRSVTITGNPEALRQDAARLFDLHGGFERVGQRADFRFAFTQKGASAVGLRIESGGRVLLEETFRGGDRTDALYLAADRAVERTLGLPGFFSGKVAFISDRTGHPEVYLTDFLFRSARQLTRDRSQCLSPDLSPDGRTVLYTSYHGTGFPDIYRIDLRTGERSLFAGFKGTNTGATFSPDGSRVAMILSGSGNSELYISDARGANLRRLTRSESLEAGPAWSPDGRRLLLTSDEMGRPQIYTMDLDRRSVTRVRTDISRHCSEPAWNPRDEDQIAFTAAMGGSFEVALFRFSEGRSRVVSKGTGDAVHPAWLADGRHLLYTERTPRYSRIMILDTNTGKRFRFSPVELNSASEAAPAG